MVVGEGERSWRISELFPLAGRLAVSLSLGGDRGIVRMVAYTTIHMPLDKTADPRDRDAALEKYGPRGAECAYGNVRLLARALGTLYEEALQPAQLRAGQLSLMWAILATEPVDMRRLGAVTLTDATTLSRTIAKLRKARLVTVRQGSDRRTKVLTLSALGRQRFADAMPYWEEAQRRTARLLPMSEIGAMAGRMRATARQRDKGI